MKRFFCAVISFCMIVSVSIFSPVTASADYKNGYQQAAVAKPYTNTPDLTAHNIDGVYQGDHINDFLKASPVSQITIDEDLINDMRNTIQGTLLFDTSKKEYAGLGFVDMYDTPSYHQADNSNVFSKNLKSEQLGSCFFVFDQQESLKNGKGLNRTGDNFFPGNLVEYVFPGAATLEDGSAGDVVFTYSNLHIALQTEDGVEASSNSNRKAIDETNLNKIKHLTIVNGNQSQIYGTSIVREDPSTGDLVLERSKIENCQRYGIQIDVNIRVVDPSTGKNTPGMFYFRVADLDVERRTQGGFSGLYNHDGIDDEGTNVNRYSEQIKLRSGYETEDYSVYLPGGFETDEIQGKGDGINVYNSDNKNAYVNNKYNNENHEGYKCTISGSPTAGYLFEPNQSDYAYSNAGTLYSGFVAVAINDATAGNPTGGVNLRLWSAGAGDASVETYLMAGFGKRNGAIAENTLFKKVLSISETGGTIQTTTKLNTTLDLTDGQTVGPGKLNVHVGSNVGYTMTAAGPGWDIDQVWVNQLQGTNLELPTKDVSALNVSEVTAAVKATQTQDASGNWRYTYYFNDADHTNVTENKSIHVTWKRVAYTEYYSNDTSLPPNVKTVLDSFLPASETEWKPDGDSFTPKNPTTTSYTDPATGVTYTFKGWDKGTTTINHDDVYFKAIWETNQPASATPTPTTPTPTPTPGTPTPGFPVFPGGGSGGGGGGSTPATPPATPTPATPEVQLPELFVPSVETTGTSVIEGTTGLTFTYGAATPLTITPVIPVGGV